jgi:hypothetical protein
MFDVNKLSEHAKDLAGIGANVALVANNPIPFAILGWPGEWKDRRFDDALFAFCTLLAESVTAREVGVVYRCVSPTHLPIVLRQGCDVKPTDAVLFVDFSTDKALEYGDRDTKVMLLFDAARMRPSHREVPSDLDPRELADLEKDHPTRLVSEDGRWLWLSRLPEGDRRINTPYETQYARWIPGDPWQALVCIVLLGREQEALFDLARREIASCGSGNWSLIA